MENWNTFIIVNVILALVVGMAGNFATELTRSIYSKSVFSSKKKRIEILVAEYKYIKTMSNNISYLAIPTLREIIRGLIQIALMILVVGYNLLFYTYDNHVSLFSFILSSIVLLLTFFFCYSTFYKAVKEIDNSVAFDLYREKTLKKIIQLGGNPEDLDKDEMN